MCGIIGYIGPRSASEICLAGLRRLEYRGYDSAGIAVVHERKLGLRRAVGKLRGLEEILGAEPLAGHVGIGHTRWATHGKPCLANSHPQIDCQHRFAVVHNGIIENYQELRLQLTAEGHRFTSQTDTEVMAHLVEKYYGGDLRDAVRQAVLALRGAFAFGIVAAEHPGELLAVRRFSPLVVGVGQEEFYIASDMGAIRAETDRVIVIEDDEICRITTEEIEITKLGGSPVERKPYVIPWPAEAAQKGGHKKFMHKEIYEQPQALRAGLAGRLLSAEQPIQLESIGLDTAQIGALERVVFTACGTALHAGAVGRFLMDKLAHIPAELELASELCERETAVGPNTICVVVSQSGETADSLEALRAMKRKGARILSILNVVDSSIARESDGVLYIYAGPEIGVAATKTYTSQVLAIILLATYFAEIRGSADPAQLRAVKQALLTAPAQVAQLLEREQQIAAIAQRHYHRQSALYLGRGIDLASALEGALKLKEISYIHAEAYSAGEMKHGPIALVCPEMFVVALALRHRSYEDMLGNLMEIKARGGPLVAVAYDGDKRVASLGVDQPGDLSEPNDMIWIPTTHEFVAPLTAIIPLQLLAYHMAELRGEHIDQPRNLAKTVTVK